MPDTDAEINAILQEILHDSGHEPTLAEYIQILKDSGLDDEANEVHNDVYRQAVDEYNAATAAS